jgi:hypothetical protein
MVNLSWLHIWFRQEVAARVRRGAAVLLFVTAKKHRIGSEQVGIHWRGMRAMRS